MKLFTWILALSVATTAHAKPAVRSDVLYVGNGPAAEKIAEEIRTVLKFSQPLDFSDTKGLPKKAEPVLLTHSAPTFPEAPHRPNFRGKVTVAFIVDEKGLVSEHAVLGCADPYIVDRIGVALATWRFKPARRGKTPVRALMRVPMQIDLN